MATKKDNNQDKIIKLQDELKKARLEYTQLRLDIKAGINKNTNSHKSLKTKIAKLLTQLNEIKLK